MTVSATGTTPQTTTATGQSNTNSSLNKLGTDFNSFLTLLTTQLKNQSPDAPVDANQFTQQLVQFAGIQQQVQTNSTLQQILGAVQGGQVSSAASYVGTNIQAKGNQGGLVKGIAQFGYNLPATATKAEVTITNSAGQVVFTGLGSTKQGDNFVTWDGVNSTTGAKEADGVYTMTVKAADNKGADMKASPFITGTVDSASVVNGVVTLGIGALQVPATSVTTVGNVAGKSTTTTGA